MKPRLGEARRGASVRRPDADAGQDAMGSAGNQSEAGSRFGLRLRLGQHAPTDHDNRVRREHKSVRAPRRHRRRLVRCEAQRETSGGLVLQRTFVHIGRIDEIGGHAHLGEKLEPSGTCARQDQLSGSRGGGL